MKMEPFSSTFSFKHDFSMVSQKYAKLSQLQNSIDSCRHVSFCLIEDNEQLRDKTILLETFFPFLNF